MTFPGPHNRKVAALARVIIRTGANRHVRCLTTYALTPRQVIELVAAADRRALRRLLKDSTPPDVPAGNLTGSPNEGSEAMQDSSAAGAGLERSRRRKPPSG